MMINFGWDVKNNPSDHSSYFILIRIFYRPMNDKTEHNIAINNENIHKLMSLKWQHCAYVKTVNGIIKKPNFRMLYIVLQTGH